MAGSRRFDTRDIARIAVFAAIIAALGLIAPIQLPGLVPITAQTLGVVLAGTVLGPLRGLAAVAVFEVLVLVGLPLLSGGFGGPSVFVGFSAGYLLGWLPGAFVTGLIAYSGRGALAWWRVAVGAVIGGIVVIYAIGIPVQAALTGLPLGATALGSLLFVPGDAIKVVVATLLTLALWRAYPPAFGRRADRRGSARLPLVSTGARGSDAVPDGQAAAPSAESGGTAR
ncbi:biotin transporter BioY [Schumannella luteola]|uniref:Biotin transport system substrate-specific component n=1 Tax=Schumannella luteola TaxID=472059 RepID=A0A852YAI8_9MICO|nr:biotin transporter BioY [Schumannella luteola]NYG99976.1 biotin transport system substrate-specific component [Schumannella luteola]TPX05481.1 biotin transporter BioY [Schumannella luteola]